MIELTHIEIQNNMLVNVSIPHQYFIQTILHGNL